MKNAKWVLVGWLLVALVAIAGCDPSEDDVTDAERFLGSWSASGLTAGNLDLLSLLGELTATFPTPTTFRMRAEDDEGTEVLNTTGTFTAEDGVMVFTPSETAKSVSMSYAFENNDDTVVLSFRGSILGEIGFEIDPSVLSIIGNQTVTATLTRQ